jgi:hypothetical protein
VFRRDGRSWNFVVPTTLFDMLLVVVEPTRFIFGKLVIGQLVVVVLLGLVVEPSSVANIFDRPVVVKLMLVVVVVKGLVLVPWLVLMPCLDLVLALAPEKGFGLALMLVLVLVFFEKLVGRRLEK